MATKTKEFESTVHWEGSGKKTIVVFRALNEPRKMRDQYDYDLDGLVQDCSISIANAMEILQSCTKPTIWSSDILRGDYI